MKSKIICLLHVALLIVVTVKAQEIRIPLFEVFSSATCDPCKTANERLKTLLDTKAPEDYVCVKFQQDFPGPGDPYCSQECIDRHIGLYNLGASGRAIPELHIDGRMPYTPFPYLSDSLYSAYKSVPATYKLNGTYSIYGQTVNVKVKYTPLAAGYPLTKLFVAIIESETVNNVKSNGETKFYNVMKKMLPSSGGMDIASTPLYTEDSLSLTYTFNGNYRLPANGQDANWINNNIEHSVENFSNLKVVAWVQGFEGNNYPVYQAANLVKENTTGIEGLKNIHSIRLYPNPVSQTLNIAFNATVPDLISVSVYSMTGTKLKNEIFNVQKRNKGNIVLDLQDLPLGNYTVVLTDALNNTCTEVITVIR